MKGAIGGLFAVFHGGRVVTKNVVGNVADAFTHETGFSYFHGVAKT